MAKVCDALALEIGPHYLAPMCRVYAINDSGVDASKTGNLLAANQPHSLGSVGSVYDRGSLGTAIFGRRDPVGGI